MIPAAGLYILALREAHEAHAEDPFDPIEVARRRIDHALEWNRRNLHRLAVTELHGVVDLARATGIELDEATIVRLDALRAAALSTWPLDTRELDWAVELAQALVERLDAPDHGHGPVLGPARPPAAQASPDGKSDEAVTVHCDERRSTVSTRFDRSVSER